MDSASVVETPTPAPHADPPGAIFLRFLKFGALAWGGPAAQIAMIKQECVDQEQWVDEETFKKTRGSCSCSGFRPSTWRQIWRTSWTICSTG
jgi:hypothetical protein